MHEDVGGVEAVDRLGQRHLAEVPVVQHLLGRRRVVEQLLHGVAVHLPRRDRVLVGVRPVGERDTRAVLQEGREPLHQVPHHVAGPPRGDRGRGIPVRDRTDAVGEAGSHLAVPLGRVDGQGHGSPQKQPGHERLLVHRRPHVGDLPHRRQLDHVGRDVDVVELARAGG